MSTTAKVLFTGRAHTTSGPNGASRSSDGFVDVKLPQPHPAAENLFASAWSACYLGAIELAASQRKIKLPEHPAIDTEIDLNRDGNSFFLRRASASACRAWTARSRRNWPRRRTGSAPTRRRSTATSRFRPPSSDLTSWPAGWPPKTQRHSRLKESLDVMRKSMAVEGQRRHALEASCATRPPPASY